MADTTQSSKSLPVCGSAASTVVAVPLPVALDDAHSLREILVQADPDNTDNIRIGNKDAQSFTLQPGETFGLPLGNPAELWHKAVSGTQTIHFLGRD